MELLSIFKYILAFVNCTVNQMRPLALDKIIVAALSPGSDTEYFQISLYRRLLGNIASHASFNQWDVLCSAGRISQTFFRS
jgi:hypothetical protein